MGVVCKVDEVWKKNNLFYDGLKNELDMRSIDQCLSTFSNPWTTFFPKKVNGPLLLLHFSCSIITLKCLIKKQSSLFT